MKGKKKVLICVNSKQKSNAFWAEFYQKLKKYDFKTTDVTVLVTSFKDLESKKYFNNLPDEVRVLVWFALPFVIEASKTFYDREALRAFGDVHFDEVLVEGDINEYFADFANNLNGLYEKEPQQD